MTYPGESGDVRIGHEERQQAIDDLGEHYARGRLELAEFEQRTARAAEARTVGDLRALFADLPYPHPLPAPPDSSPGIRSHPAAPPAPEPMATASVPLGQTPEARCYSDKSKVAAGVLQIFLPFGVGRFYTGHTGIALGQLLLSFCGIGMVWSFIDGIILLTGEHTDRQGRWLRN